MDVYETECHLALQKWTDWKVFLAPDAQLMCMDGSKSCTYKGDTGNPVVLLKDDEYVCLAGIYLYDNGKCYKPEGRLIANNANDLLNKRFDRKRTKGEEEEGLYIIKLILQE
ncbi:uncharacterized protein LOC142356208 [Convolutriloba macropyga]|uniref:uncharacterized protein LOC142356208 n=1 Tax=Convolutriloba macropyga TaxID=536237 RepID=UPI003F51EC23